MFKLSKNFIFIPKLELITLNYAVIDFSNTLQSNLNLQMFTQISLYIAQSITRYLAGKNCE